MHMQSHIKHQLHVSCVIKIIFRSIIPHSIWAKMLIYYNISLSCIIFITQYMQNGIFHVTGDFDKINKAVVIIL